jgi:hypothetical protein
MVTKLHRAADAPARAALPMTEGRDERPRGLRDWGRRRGAVVRARRDEVARGRPADFDRLLLRVRLRRRVLAANASPSARHRNNNSNKR